MNKVVLTVAALAVSAVIITPKIISHNIEQDTRYIVAEINKLPMYNVELVSSDFGWFQSSAKVKVNLELSYFGSEAINVDELGADFSLTFKHGVLIKSGLNLFDFSIHVENQPDIAGLVWDKSQPLYRLDGAYSVIGNLSFTDKSPHILYKDEQGYIVEFSPYEGKAETVNGLLTHTSALPSFTVQMGSSSAQFRGLTTNAKFAQPITEFFSTNQVHEYEYELEIANWTMRTEDRFQLNLDDLSMTMSSLLDDKKHVVNSKITYDLDKFEIDGYSGSDVELVIETNNVDEQSYLKLNELLKFQPSQNDPLITANNLITFFQDNLINILAPEPEVNITSFKGLLPQGSFDINLHTKLEKIEQAPKSLAALPFWLSQLQASSDAKISKTLLRAIAKLYVKQQIASHPNFAQLSTEEVEQHAEAQVPQFIAGLEQQRIIVAEQDFYTFHFKMADKVAKLNGQQLSLPL